MCSVKHVLQSGVKTSDSSPLANRSQSQIVNSESGCQNHRLTTKQVSILVDQTLRYTRTCKQVLQLGGEGVKPSDILLLASKSQGQESKPQIPLKTYMSWEGGGIKHHNPETIKSHNTCTILGHPWEATTHAHPWCGYTVYPTYPPIHINIIYIHTLNLW